MKKRYIFIFLIYSFICIQTKAQDLNFNEEIRRRIESGGKNSTAPADQDTMLRVTSPSESEELFEEEGALSIDSPDDATEDQLEQDTIPAVSQEPVAPPLSMSPEAIYWARDAVSYNTFGPDVTFRDTVIVNSLFMPVLFREGHIRPEEKISLYRPMDYSTTDEWLKPLYRPVTIFEKQAMELYLNEIAYQYVQQYHPEYFHYNAQHLPTETTHFIRREKRIEVPVEKIEIKPTDYTTPTKFLPDRKYWTSSFESDIKFSQNYVSPNWYKGGVSNMNIFTKNLIKYNYAKDRIIFTNMMEINASMYSAPKDTLRNYKLGDDLFRYYANFGYRAFSKWFYTLGAEFKTQMFTNYQENTTVKQAALLSPFIVNVEPGMKYDLVKKYSRKDRSLTIALNVSPFSYNYMYSMDRNIDLGRHGFQKNEADVYEYRFSKFGSTLRYDMVVKPNRNVTWKTRFYYFTSYDHIIAEYENSLDLAISRYFSTLIYVNLRYDDGVAKTEDFDSFLQTNEILSFGLSYKW
ncbi:MAG: DUF3078 domain-containing protein [Tannerella sp.]|jgi:hypothetical protein|nr:DUF3078 domain-containing protein [Tannerella sp.]